MGEGSGKSSRRLWRSRQTKSQGGKILNHDTGREKKLMELESQMILVLILRSKMAPILQNKHFTASGQFGSQSLLSPMEKNKEKLIYMAVLLLPNCSHSDHSESDI